MKKSPNSSFVSYYVEFIQISMTNTISNIFIIGVDSLQLPLYMY